MKSMLIFILVASLIFSFLLTGCDEDGAATGLTDEEVETIAMASLGSAYIPTLFDDEGVFPTDGVYDGTGLFSGLIVSGTLNIDTVNATTTLLTFTACALDLDGGGADLTLGGAVSVEFGDPDITIFDAFNVIGIMPGTDTVINIIVAGTQAMTETTFTMDITLSGITAQACAVVVVMTLDIIGDPVEVELATIDGVDYTDEFNTAFYSLFG